MSLAQAGGTRLPGRCRCAGGQIRVIPVTTPEAPASPADVVVPRSTDQATSMIHETFRALPWHLMGGAEILPRGRDWILVALPLVILVVVILFPWSLRLPRRTLLLFVGSAVLFLGGSIGFELIEGYYGFRPDSQPLVIQCLITIEEVLEMAGVVLAFYAMLDYARMQRLRVAVDFGDLSRPAVGRS